MSLGRAAAAAAFFLACLLAVEPARAVGRLLAPPGSASEAPQIRVALALSPEQTSIWWSFALVGPARRVALVVPARPGTAVDPASPAWFRALERATAPRILLTDGTRPQCGGAELSSVHDTSAAFAASEIPIAELAVLSSLDAVRAFAVAHGLAYQASDQQALLPYASSHEFIALTYDVPAQGAWTETLRLTVRGSEPQLGLELLGQGAAIPVTIWTIAGGRAALPPGRELASADLGTVWNLARGDSDYAQRRADALQAQRQSAWVIEASSDERLFEWHVVAQGSAAIPPVVGGYFTGSDAESECSARAFEIKATGLALAGLCAPGRLAIVDAPSPCTDAPIGKLADPHRLICGALDDLALALAGLTPEKTWVTRHTGVFLEHSTQRIGIDDTLGQPVSPVVAASAVDATGCDATGGVGGSYGAGGAVGGGFGNGGWGGAGGNGGAPGTGGGWLDPRPEPDPVIVHEGSSVDVSCYSGGGSDCSGDSSSSNQGSGDDSCNGDSNSDDANADSEGCGCDSEDSSDSEGGDDCSSDSSSDGGEDCSGDSGGDSCNGDSGGDCGGGEVSMSPAALGVGVVLNAATVCALPRRKAFRPRMSAAALLLTAVALCVRRRQRHSRYPL